MLQHVLIADLGVALIVLALRGPLTVFFLPRAALVPLARSRLARRSGRFLTRPAVALPLWLVVLVVWHIPTLYEAALDNTVLHDVEHLAFVTVGTLVWVILVDPTRHGRLSTTERIGVAAVVFWASQILAYVIVFDPNPLFDGYTQQDERLLGLSPLTDQKLAGVVMMVEQLVTVGACLLVLVNKVRRERALRAAGAPA
jgi:cytochrome c oxidase assembly factor CtaG